mmetsp:Transcript_88860/g.259718  ORF Transcript_88860/g.259718 Transcript_88860/m.259718 type:complete len:216 (+) Transcript_88860:2314-2961(+)
MELLKGVVLPANAARGRPDSVCQVRALHEPLHQLHLLLLRSTVRCRRSDALEGSVELLVPPQVGGLNDLRHQLLEAVRLRGLQAPGQAQFLAEQPLRHEAVVPLQREGVGRCRGTRVRRVQRAVQCHLEHAGVPRMVEVVAQAPRPKRGDLERPQERGACLRACIGPHQARAPEQCEEELRHVVNVLEIVVRVPRHVPLDFAHQQRRGALRCPQC